MEVAVEPNHEVDGLPRPGDVIDGKYKVERLLGRGGMGAVYSARHVILQTRVAIKLLLTEIADDPDAVGRLLNEARSAARIPSEHVVRVLDVGVEGRERPFIVMEYLDGADLARILERDGPLPVSQVVDYVLQALAALAQAHALGIVHRDLKPSNLFVAERDDGTRVLKVLDFGICKAPSFGGTAFRAVTAAQAVLGSPAYMSPEQVRSARSVGPSSDVWSVGVILFELLAGELPFDGMNVTELIAAILETAPRPLGTFRPDVPPRLIAVIERCLARATETRFGGVEELAEALAPFGSPTGAPSIAMMRTAVAALAARSRHEVDRTLHVARGEEATLLAPQTSEPPGVTETKIAEPTSFKRRRDGRETQSSWSDERTHSSRRAARSRVALAVLTAALALATIAMLGARALEREPALASTAAERAPSDRASVPNADVVTAARSLGAASASSSAAAGALAPPRSALGASIPRAAPHAATPRRPPPAKAAPPSQPAAALPTLTRDRH